MMNKEKKKAYISEMTSEFDKSEAVIVTHYQGLTVNQLDELRAKMREHGIIFRIPQKVKSFVYGFVCILHLPWYFLVSFNIIIANSFIICLGFIQLLKETKLL